MGTTAGTTSILWTTYAGGIVVLAGTIVSLAAYLPYYSRFAKAGASALASAIIGAGTGLAFFEQGRDFVTQGSAELTVGVGAVALLVVVIVMALFGERVFGAVGRSLAESDVNSK